MKPQIISHFIIIGDSLSDRGTANRRLLLRYLTTLHNKSPQGRFTNGYTWSDHICAKLISEFIIRELKNNKGMSPTEISDAILSGEVKVEKPIHESYILNNDLYVKYKNTDFVRNYSEAGLTSYNYSWMPSVRFTRFATRLIVSTLGSQLAKLLAYDQKSPPSKTQQEQTLVVEWSGTNDLITVNAAPSKLEVDRAVQARIINTEQLIQQGYSHFVLFNLPDLSLTPFYQALSEAAQANAYECIEYFNAELAKACQTLRETYPHCSVDVFDINSRFKEIYEDPEKYGFVKEKRTQPYILSPEFKIKEDGTSPAKGFLFWDNIHPTAHMHALLAEDFYATYSLSYNFSAPQVEQVPQPPRPQTDPLPIRLTSSLGQNGFFSPPSYESSSFSADAVLDPLSTPNNF